MEPPNTTTETVAAWREHETEALKARSHIDTIISTALSHLQFQSEEQAKKADVILDKLGGVLRQFETITSDAIADHVESIWIKDLAETYRAIKSAELPTTSYPQLELQLKRIEQRLSDADVSWITPETGKPMNPKIHKPVSTLTTPDASLHGSIAQVFTHGLIRKGRLMQHAKVVIFRYEEPTNSTQTQ